MTRDRLTVFVTSFGIVTMVASGAAVLWASTLPNPDFAEPLVWLFAGSIAVTKVAFLILRSPGARADKAEKLAEGAAVAGALGLMLGEEGQ